MSAPVASASSGRPGPSSDEPVLKLRSLSKRFPKRRTWGEIVRRPFYREYQQVLQDVSLDVRRGEFFGLLGPNGAGKTTLFKILATLVLPDGGEASVLGRDVVDEAARVRQVLTPVIADERSMFWRLSAFENLRVFAGLYGLRGEEARSRATELLEIVGLSDTGEKLVGAFSSGMKQRLLIGRALMSRPRLLLLDEPTRSLDPVSARNFRQFLREDVAQRHGCTVMLATHNADEALSLCDRVGVLHRGRLLAVGAVEELAARVSEERYRLISKRMAAERLAELERDGHIRSLERHPAEDGWVRFDMEIPGGWDESSYVLAEIAGCQVPVARFERLELTLAELLERILAEAADA